MAEKKDKTLNASFPSFIFKMRPSKNIIGREEETNMLLEILLKKRMRNVMLIGQPGIGKTELVRHIASIANDCIFYEWGIGGCLMDTRYRGTFEKKVVNMLTKAKKEAQTSGKTIVLFVDEAHMIMGAGQSEGDRMDLNNILKSYLSNCDVVVWGATTINEYKEAIKKDGAFRRRFSTIVMNELKGNDLIKIVANFSEGKLTEDEIIEVVRSSSDIEWMHQPDACIELADRCMAHKRYSNIKELTGEDILILANSMRDAMIED